MKFFRVYYEDGEDVEVWTEHLTAFSGMYPNQPQMLSYDDASGGTDLDISKLPGGVTELKIEFRNDVDIQWDCAFSCIEPESEVALFTMTEGNVDPSVLNGSVSQNGDLITIDLTAFPEEVTHIRFKP